MSFALWLFVAFVLVLSAAPAVLCCLLSACVRDNVQGPHRRHGACWGNLALALYAAGAAHCMSLLDQSHYGYASLAAVSYGLLLVNMALRLSSAVALCGGGR